MMIAVSSKSPRAVYRIADFCCLAFSAAFRKDSREKGGKRGQALVEFCFCLPLLIFVLVAMIEFGRLYAAWYTIEQACFEGCRLAAEQGLNQAQVQERVNSILGNIQGLGISDTTVTLTTVGATDIQLEISAKVDVMLPTNIGRWRIFNADKFPITVRHRTRI